jgi:hypothetical protein
MQHGDQTRHLPQEFSGGKPELKKREKYAKYEYQKIHKFEYFFLIFF